MRFLSGNTQQNIEFSLRVDNIAQEFDETFVITLEVPEGTFGQGANIRNRLEGVIIDSDGRLTQWLIKVLAIQLFLSPTTEIDFTLSEEDYTQNEEPNAVLDALITKGSGVALANPVYFRASLLTVDDAIARGVISEFEDENPFSPNRASRLSLLCIPPPLLPFNTSQIGGNVQVYLIDEFNNINTVMV